MYHRWLDRWDEQRAQRGEEAKKTTKFSLDAEVAFPSAGTIRNIDQFCILADRALADPTFFDETQQSDHGFQRDEEWLTFPSAICTDIDENNLVRAKITESGTLDHALVVFHHWNATKRQNRLAKYFSKHGITVVEIAMPYHFERTRPGSSYADYMLSPSLGRTIQSVRQAVLDGRKLIRWLKEKGYRKISVFGMSLGSWVAGIIAAHDLAVSKASLFLSAGSLADMVWTGRATRAIRQSVEPHIELIDLRKAWGPLDIENFAGRLTRPDLDIQIAIAKRDNVVFPEYSQELINTLVRAGAKPDVIQFDCGHYSLALPPFIMLAGWKLKRFLAAPARFHTMWRPGWNVRLRAK